MTKYFKPFTTLAVGFLLGAYAWPMLKSKV